MKAKVIRKFIDLKANKTMEIGNVFEVSKERFEELNKTHHGILIEQVEVKTEGVDKK